MAALLEGALSILAALEAGKRDIHEIQIDREKRFDRRLAQVRTLAAKKRIPMRLVDAAQIDEVAQGKTHGGLIAHVGERRYDELSDLLPRNKAAFVVMLDGVEDPYNFGFALRALYAAGVDGVLLPERNWTSASGIVGRASAGALERMPLALVENAFAAAELMRQHGLRVAATGKSAASASVYEADLTQPLFLLIGGERRGVTRSFHAAADLVLELPYGRQGAASLGTVSAASAIAFEVLRQRRNSGVS